MRSLRVLTWLPNAIIYSRNSILMGKRRAASYIALGIRSPH